MDKSLDSESQEQVKRDKMMRGKRRRYFSGGKESAIEKSNKMQLARDLINDLEHHGPAGLVHIAALSSVISTPIRIWTRGRLNQIVGQPRNENPIDIEYQENKSNDIGHWTLKGNKDPMNIEIDLNGCLFATIASQIGSNASDLRAATIKQLKKNVRVLADRIDEILWYEKNDSLALMIGGARYNGTSARAAAIILDKSQNAMCYTCRDSGHPRGHASHKEATGPKDSVENYSRTTNSMKSGFLSRNDQDTVAHAALSHAEAQRAMERLNSGSFSQAIHLSARELESSNYSLPKMKEYYNGTEYSGELDIIRVTLVLRHHAGEQNNRDADVFVHTFYPRSS